MSPLRNQNEQLALPGVRVSGTTYVQRKNERIQSRNQGRNDKCAMQVIFK